MISQQVSSLNCLQWLTRKCTTNESKYVEIRDPFCIQLFVYTFFMNFVYKLYTCLSCLLFVDQNWCMQNVCIQTVSHILTIFCINFVYKMCTKCLHAKCIPHFNKLLYIFCIQNLAGIWFFIRNVYKNLSKCGMSLTKFPVL